MPSIADTTLEMIEWVFPEHAGGPGQIHGGRMMEWITKAGTLAASRVARGTVVLGAMDDIDFLHPVKVGQIAILRARVEYVGTSSLEVGVRVFAEDVITGERRATLNSHLVVVKVDEGVRPRPVEAKIRPRDAAESALVEAARARREQRLARFAQRQSRLAANAEPDLDASDVDVGWRFESVRSVLPEDALFGNTMFVGKMLMALDEAGGILSMRYCKGLVMTACVDAMDFYSPIFTHEVVTFKAALNHVGTSSLEVGVKVLAEVPWSGEVRHACTAFVTYVHLGADLRPRPCSPYTPPTAGARRRWEAALGSTKEGRTMSGHSRWAQIKRKKGKTDVQRGKLFSKILREITVAAKNGGGDPKANMRLKAAIESAKEANMPQDNIKRAIQKGTGELPGESYEEISYEGYAPGGVAVLVQVLTDNRNRTGPEIRHVFEKFGGNMGSSGAVAWMFERQGIIQVDASKIDEDDLLGKALDAGATDMRRAEKAFEIITAPAEMDAVRDALNRARVPVLEGQVNFVPQSTVRVEGKDATSVVRLIEALEELDDVQSVYANYDIPDEVLEAISAA